MYIYDLLYREGRGRGKGCTYMIYYIEGRGKGCTCKYTVL